jgi:hypothetical protein
MSIGTARERGTFSVPITFSLSGSTITPDAITYSVSTLDGTIVNAVSNVSVVTPASVVTITISGTTLSTLGIDDDYIRVLTIKMTYSTTRIQNDEDTFKIKPLVRVPG